MVPNPQKKPWMKGMMIMSRRVITVTLAAIEGTLFPPCCVCCNAPDAGFFSSVDASRVMVEEPVARADSLAWVS